MDRIDYYDIRPAGMDAYLATHGRHFSKSMLEWAVSMMEGRNGNKIKVLDRKKFDDMMNIYSQKLSRNEESGMPAF